MFYLMMHSTHLFIGMSRRTYVKDHSDSERGNHAATLSHYQQGFFNMHHPTDKIAHTTAFVTPVSGLKWNR